MSPRTSLTRRLRRADNTASTLEADPETAAPTSRLVSFFPLLLARAAHPRLGLLMALGLAGAAALSGRSTAAVAMVLATVVVGQAILGWTNDLVDRRRDLADERVDKPLAQGTLDPGDVRFALACAVLLVVPLAISHGAVAGLSYLGALALGLLGNVVLRRGFLSWVSWAASFALYPAFLAYGGFAGDGQDTPPEISVTVLAAALGVCVHVLVALPGLVLDHEHDDKHLSLRLALRVGAARLLWATVAVTALVLVGLFLAGVQVGLRQ